MIKKLTAYVFASIIITTVQTVNLTVSYAAIPFFEKENNIPTLAPVLKKAFPAIVNISIVAKKKEIANPLFNDPFFKHFFKDFDEFRFRIPHQEQDQSVQSIGSGVIIDAFKGHVVTNHHVIEQADEIFITLHDKRKVKAKLLGSDKATDIAILKIDEKKLTSLPIGDSDKIEVGDFAIAIGNPFGLNNTVTSGIISGLSRSGLGIEGYEDFIQTDASINPGNSGGALVNLRGELIGINTAILSGNGGNIGIGFAIPYNMVKTVTQQLIQHGEVKRGQIGIYTQNITPELSEAMNINVKHGALISKVNKDSPAEKSGLKEGDVIVKIDGKDVENIAALRNAIGLKQIGTKVNVTFIRGKETKSVQTDIVYPNEIEDSLSDTIELPKLKGTRFSHIPTTHPMYGKIEGVMITSIEKNSQAWRTGLKSGDIVVSVNRQKIKNLKELKNAVLLKKDGILMKVQRENAAMYIFLTSE